nr:MAG TPA: major tail protein [Caudoviricetes sp.]
MKYTKIPTDTFKNLQLNAGVLLKSFDVETQTLAADSIVGATSGGVSFTAVPSFTDFGEDIDNCPKNMKEMKKLDSWEAKMSGTFASVSKSLAKTLVGAADLAGSKITPRNDLAAADFSDLWWVGDYSEVNEDGTSTGKAGFIAIHLLNSLSTGGFSIQSSDKGKGQFEFEFTGHYSMEDQDKVPFEVYVQEGTAA